MRKTLGILLTSALLVTEVGFAARPAAPVPAAAPAAAPAAEPPRGKGRFAGSHPLSGLPSAGYCYIDVPHVHDYLPARPALYQQNGDSYVFTGDPVPFGYDGAKTVFYGHHPVPIVVDADAPEPNPTFCFLKGPHYHDYPQPEGPGYKVKDNVVFYVGPIPPEVAAVRPQAEKALEVEFRPYVAQRPQVTVTPPPEWTGAVWVPPPAPVVVAAPVPAVVVAPPTPVVVAPPQVVVAPPPVVVAPHPVVVAPPVIIGAPPAVIFTHGKGKGWKGGRGWGHYGWGGKGHWKH